MKINEIIQETTSAGGIATVAAPLGAMQKRPNPSVFSKNKNKKKKTEDVTKGNFGGQADVPQLPHQEVLMAISAWEYGDTPIELSNGYVINAYEEGASADDNAWIVLDPQGNEYDSGTGSIVDIMQEFTSKLIDEAKANPMIMNRDGKEIVLTKSGDSMKPKFHLKINGKDHGTFDSEKAAMQHSARLKEANANQQSALYNPDGKTYRQQPMPHLDDRDPVNKAQDFDSFDDDDLTYDQDLDKDILIKQRNKKLSKMLDTLKPAERKLIALRYGLDGEDQHALEVVGDMFGITRERVRQIEAKILRTFRHPDMHGDLKDTMPEGKSPHKKGTKKYKKHMAAMHAEATLQTGGYGKPKKSRHQQKI